MLAEKSGKSTPTHQVSMKLQPNNGPPIPRRCGGHLAEGFNDCFL